jgi:hypothetical protein
VITARIQAGRTLEQARLLAMGFLASASWDEHRPTPSQLTDDLKMKSEATKQARQDTLTLLRKGTRKLHTQLDQGSAMSALASTNFGLSDASYRQQAEAL